MTSGGKKRNKRIREGHQAASQNIQLSATVSEGEKKKIPPISFRDGYTTECGKTLPGGT